MAEESDVEASETEGEQWKQPGAFQPPILN